MCPYRVCAPTPAVAEKQINDISNIEKKIMNDFEIHTTVLVVKYDIRGLVHKVSMYSTVSTVRYYLVLYSYSHICMTYSSSLKYFDALSSILCVCVSPPDSSYVLVVQGQGVLI